MNVPIFCRTIVTTLLNNLVVIALSDTEGLPDHFEHRLLKLEQSQLRQRAPKIQYTVNDIKKSINAIHA